MTQHQGTAAHELAEHKLHQLLGEPSTRPISDWHDEEMEDHTDTYADHVMAELARTKEGSPAAFLSIEERLDFSHIVPDGFGTGDAAIVGDDTMTIVDLKYGKGVQVSAENNPQMRLYALGALARYGMIYDIRCVRMVIFQPRLNNVSVEEIDVDELTTWAREVVEPAAQLAAAGQGELTPATGAPSASTRHNAPRCRSSTSASSPPTPRVHQKRQTRTPSPMSRSPRSSPTPASSKVARQGRKARPRPSQPRQEIRRVEAR